MHSSLLILEIQANALEQERRNRQLMHDQIRLAQLQRRSTSAGALMAIRQHIGAFLIGVGERLSPEPVKRSDCTNTAMNA